MYSIRNMYTVFIYNPGGTTLYLECVKLLTGTDKEKENPPSFNVTGNMAKVMEESSKIAYTYSRTLMQEIDPDNDFFFKSSIHLHSPEVCGYRIICLSSVVVDQPCYSSLYLISSCFVTVHY